MEEAFDHTIDPPPDLAIEVDITRRSIPREPIYAALGVPELWRFEKQRLVVRILQGDSYVDSDASLSFPFLPMQEFQRFVLRLNDEPRTVVVREFGAWVRSL
jgi:Uma2 family endonuclease